MERKMDFAAQEGRKNCMIISSKFSILFPQYQEKYIRESWNIIARIVRPYGLEVKLDLSLGKMQVKTTNRARDPFVIFKARDFLRLLSRSVPVEQACKIFEDQIFCDIVKISTSKLNKERFLKRRRRLIGHRGLTIRAIEIITQCYLLIQGNTVSCMGKHEGLKVARKIIQECMLNIHPITQVKMLWFKKNLSQDPNFKSRSWDTFFPKIKKNLSEKSRKFSQPPYKKKKKENSFQKNQENLFHEKRIISSKRKNFISLESNTNIISPFEI